MLLRRPEQLAGDGPTELMQIEIFHILHVSCAVMLVAINFWAFASPKPEQKRQLMKWSGIASLGAVVGGFGLQGMLHVGFPGWLVIKIICWLGLSAIAGFAYRHPERVGTYVKLTIALAVLAVSAVYLRPF